MSYRNRAVQSFPFQRVYDMGKKALTVGLVSERGAKFLKRTGGRKPKAKKPSKNKAPAQPLQGKGQERKRKKKLCKGIGGKVGKELCSLNDRLKALKLESEQSLGTKTFRVLNFSTMKSLAGAQAVSYISCNSVARIETAITTMQLYNPATGVVVAQNFNTGTYQRKILFKSITQKTVYRNNYNTDLKIRVYLCKPRGDTAISPTNAWSNSIADNATGITAITDLNQYPSDYDEFKDLWSSKVLVDVNLSPGQSVNVSHTERDFEYDPATADNEPDNFQQRYKSFGFLTMIQGTLAHDSVDTGLQGYAAAGVDISNQRTAVICYDAGVNLSWLEVVNTIPAFTATAQQSHQPQVAQTPYAI